MSSANSREYWGRKVAQLRGSPFVAAIESSGIAFSLADPHEPDMPLVYVNPAFCELTGYSEADVLGRNCRFLQGGEGEQAGVDKIRDAIGSYTSTAAVIRNVRKDGTPFWNELFISPVWSEQGDLIYYVGSQIDVTAEIDAKDRLGREVSARAADTRSQASDLRRVALETAARADETMTLVHGMLRLSAGALPVGEAQDALFEAASRAQALRELQAYAGEATGDSVPAGEALDRIAEVIRHVTDRTVVTQAVGDFALSTRLVVPFGAVLAEAALDAKSDAVTVTLDRIGEQIDARISMPGRADGSARSIKVASFYAAQVGATVSAVTEGGARVLTMSMIEGAPSGIAVSAE